MNPPYQPPGPQQAFPSAMPPPDVSRSTQRSVPSHLQLPAPRDLLKYADSYHHASSQPQNLPEEQQHPPSHLPATPTHHPIAPPPPQSQNYQSHQQQHQQQLPALNSAHTSQRPIYATDAPQIPAGGPHPVTKPVLAPVSNVDEVVGYKYQ